MNEDGEIYIMVEGYCGGSLEAIQENMKKLAIRIGIDVRSKMNDYEYCASPEIAEPVTRHKIPGK